MKHVLVILFVLCFWGFNADAQEATLKQKSLTMDIVSIKHGAIGLDYEHQLSIKQSIIVKIKGWRWSEGEKEGEGLGYGVGYRYYFYRPLNGSFYGLGIELFDMAAFKNKNSSNQFGRQFYLAHHIQMGVMLRAYYGIGQLRDVDFPHLGLLLVPNFSIGYRF
jgi:hypothetical protein